MPDDFSGRRVVVTGGGEFRATISDAAIDVDGGLVAALTTGQAAYTGA